MMNQRLLMIAFCSMYATAACSGDDDDDNAAQGGNGGNAAQAGRAGSSSGSGNSDAGTAGRGGTANNGGRNANAGGEPDGGRASDGGADAGGDGGDGEGGDGGGIVSDTCAFPAGAELEGASVPDGYCAYTWASGLSKPRGVVVDSNGDVIVIDNGKIVLLYDDDADGVSGAGERVVLTTQSGLNHGVALHDGYLYASSPTTVHRWPYASDRVPLGAPQSVVTGIPSGGHSTRSLQFDTQGRLYVSVGSGTNVDSNSDRARIVRYAANALGSTSTFAQGELFADGLRNEVGLTLDADGRLWGVENGRDDLDRPDLGADIHQDNPGEELNLFLEANAGRFYGYPYCWSEFNLPTTGDGPTTQWADPDNTTHDDAWCKNPDNVLPPVLVMQGHSAPLDVRFYSGSAFPADVVGDAFITFHGSWNRTTATGYKVVRVPFGSDGMPSGSPVALLESANPGDTDDDWPHRPVSLGIGKQGQLLVTSDASGLIIAVGHEPD